MSFINFLFKVDQTYWKTSWREGRKTLRQSPKNAPRNDGYRSWIWREGMITFQVDWSQLFYEKKFNDLLQL